MSEPIYFNCSVHPSRIGFVDLGIGTENRYPCKECYEGIVKKRKTEFIKKHHETVIKENRNE